jgi:hypothetical protein
LKLGAFAPESFQVAFKLELFYFGHKPQEVVAAGWEEGGAFADIGEVSGSHEGGSWGMLGENELVAGHRLRHLRPTSIGRSGSPAAGGCPQGPRNDDQQSLGEGQATAAA